MSMSRTALAGFILVMFLSILLPNNVAAENNISADFFKQHTSRIIWIDWHSGEKSYSTEGTLQTVHPEQNCIGLLIKRKFAGEALDFDGTRILYINISAIDAFEIRLHD
jgi:hypothetical protein